MDLATAVTVGDLAEALGLQVSDLIAEGEQSFGSIAAAPRPSGCVADLRVGRPPRGAGDLAQALGAPDAYARSVGVHMSDWVVALPGGIVGTLEAPPRGEPVAGVSLPAASARVLGEDDVIRHLRRQP